LARQALQGFDHDLARQDVDNCVGNRWRVELLVQLSANLAELEVPADPAVMAWAWLLVGGRAGVGVDIDYVLSLL
jgi:hypothetical protein